MATWRRKRKRQGFGSFAEYSWSTYEEKEDMAVGGSAMPAFECKVQANELVTVRTTRLRTDCATVDDAIERLERGETVVVAGPDMERLRQKLAGLGIG